MTDRIAKLQAYMERRQLDAILITEPKHVYYLTGFASNPHERFLGLALTNGQAPVLIVPALDEEAARLAARTIDTIVTHTDTDNPYAVLKAALPSGITQLGIEKSHMTVNRFEAISDGLGITAFVDVEKPLRDMRAVKSKDEIVRMKHAVKLIEDVLHAGLKHVIPGVTEIELVAELEYQMKKLGSDGPSFPTMVLTGANAALPHGVPGTTAVREGELLLFDMGVYADGYASDITRTFAVGGVNAQLADIYDAVLQGNLRAIDAIKPGVTYASIDRAARESIAARGFGPQFMHRLGHGLGIDVHEYPSVHGNNEELLIPGVAFTVEPGVYVPGVAGVRIEDDIVVTEDGVEVLTAFPKELTVIG